MKIAYVANSRFPSEKAQSDQVMAMCSAFAALGHDLTLYVPDRRPVQAEDPFVYYGLPRTFSFVRIPCIDALRWPWLGPLGFWIQTMTFLHQLRARLRTEHPDVVYSRELYVFAARKVPGLHMWESHDLHATPWARRIAQSLDGIITLTQASRDRLHQAGVRQERLLVEPDAVDPKLFEGAPSREDARHTLGIAPETFFCLYTGKFRTMGMGKGLEEGAAAVRMLRQEGRNVQLLAVGGTKEDLAVSAPLEGEGLALQGHRPQRDLKTYYAAADFLLMPFPYTEHYAYYMSPLKLFEYLMSGVPMVVTELPSVREIVDERSAFIALPGDVPSLAACIRQAMDDPADAQTRAWAAQTLAARYTWQSRAARIMDWVASHRTASV